MPQGALASLEQQEIRIFPGGYFGALHLHHDRPNIAITERPRLRNEKAVDGLFKRLLNCRFVLGEARLQHFTACDHVVEHSVGGIAAVEEVFVVSVDGLVPDLDQVSQISTEVVLSSQLCATAQSDLISPCRSKKL